MQDKFLWRAYDGKVTQIKVVKETEKQYKLESNLVRSTINKKELNLKLWNGAVFSTTKEDAIFNYNSYIEIEIDRLENRIDILKSKIISEE